MSYSSKGTGNFTMVLKVLSERIGKCKVIEWFVVSCRSSGV